MNIEDKIVIGISFILIQLTLVLTNISLENTIVDNRCQCQKEASE